MPTRFERFLCWALFTLAMSALGWALHRVVPPTVAWLGEQVGPALVLSALVAVWIPIAILSYRAPLLAALARRRSRVGQG